MVGEKHNPILILYTSMDVCIECHTTERLSQCLPATSSSPPWPNPLNHTPATCSSFSVWIHKLCSIPKLLPHKNPPRSLWGTFLQLCSSIRGIFVDLFKQSNPPLTSFCHIFLLYLLSFLGLVWLWQCCVNCPEMIREPCLLTQEFLLARGRFIRHVSEGKESFLHLS